MSMPMLAGVGLLVVCCSSSSAMMMMGGGEEKEDPVVPKTPAGSSVGPSVTGPDEVVPPSEYKYVGDGGCDNEATKVGNACRGNVECDYIGQQSNGCWHLLDSTGTGSGIGSYPKNILPITPVSTTYKYVTGGPCSGAGDYQAVGVTCGDTPGCDTIGVQTNGCWHLLDSTGTGSGLGPYSNGIMSVE